MSLKGTGHKDINFDLMAQNGDGVYIPCMPSITMARKLAKGDIQNFGARPCVSDITLDAYLDELSDLDITTDMNGNILKGRG